MIGVLVLWVKYAFSTPQAMKSQGRLPSGWYTRSSRLSRAGSERTSLVRVTYCLILTLIRSKSER